MQDHGLDEQKIVNRKLIALARELDIPLVVTNDIHYVEQEDWEAQDCLRCIGFKENMNEPHQTMGGDRHEWYFKTEAEMRALFPDVPDAFDNTVKIAAMCNLTIHQYKTQELKDCLPRFELPPEFRTHGEDYQSDQNDYVRHLVYEGLKQRYPEITGEIRERAEYELNIIFSMGFSGYFLIVWEFINWAKKNGKPIGPGRGSGAGSLVAYAMTITEIIQGPPNALLPPAALHVHLAYTYACIKNSSIPFAAAFPAPIARITVAAPVTASPPAYTPALVVCPFSSCRSEERRRSVLWQENCKCKW